MHSFFRKTAFITGAASGIGRALAIELAKVDCHLALSDINMDGLKETQELIVNPEINVRLYKLDVADRKAYYEISEKVIDDFNGIQIVINNAGVALNGTVETISYENFEWIMGINFWGMVYGTKAFLPHLLAQEESWLVNISSIFGIIGVPSQSTYNASKFAIRGFTESLRQEVHGSSLSVSCVHPGGVKTNIARSGRLEPVFATESDRQTIIDRFDKVARTSPEKAAKTILNGMRRKKKRIMVGVDSKLLALMARLFPSGYDWLIRKGSGDMFDV